MTRSEFVREIASHMGVDIPEAKIWVEVIFDELTKKIMTEDKVVIMDFGTFKRERREPQRRRDINTKELKVYPAKTYVIFKPSEYLKWKVAEEAPLKNK